jgi:hypothetical protein
MREHAVTAALTVSFQRYPYPPSGWVEALPRSRGALPLVVTAPDRLLLACPSGEAFWIGLVATRPGRSSRVGVAARLAAGERVDLATGAASDTGAGPAPTPATGAGPAGGLLRPRFEVPPRFAVEGIARQEGGWWALALEAPGPAAPACAGLELAVWTGPAPAAPREGGDPRPLHDPTDPGDPTGPTRRSSPPPAAEAPTNPPALLRVDLVDAAGFEAATGQRLPQPADDGATYGGWRLP